MTVGSLVGRFRAWLRALSKPDAVNVQPVAAVHLGQACVLWLLCQELAGWLAAVVQLRSRLKITGGKISVILFFIYCGNLTMKWYRKWWWHLHGNCQVKYWFPFMTNLSHSPTPEEGFLFQQESGFYCRFQQGRIFFKPFVPFTPLCGQPS